MIKADMFTTEPLCILLADKMIHMWISLAESNHIILIRLSGNPRLPNQPEGSQDLIYHKDKITARAFPAL